jgi:uncharacterized protein (UPF0248 family)
VIPIQDLLNRIRHDPDFGSGRIELGYADRFDPVLQRVALWQVTFPENQKRVFTVKGPDGITRRIPFHRVREVYRNGRLIWRRPTPQSQSGD